LKVGIFQIAQHDALYFWTALECRKKKNNMVMACILRVLSNVTLLAHMLSVTYKCHLFLLDIPLLTSTSKIYIF
jgi:hypothetical protein